MITNTPIFPKNEVPALVKVCEVAELFSVSKVTVYKYIDCGQLAGASIGVKTSARRHLRVTRDSLLNFYEKRFGHSLERALAHHARKP